MGRFTDHLKRRVLFLDVAMGTSIHKYDLDLAKDYLDKENCTEILVQTRPDVIQQIHESFLAVGADAVETDTFGANKLVFAEFDLVGQTRELNKVAAEVARAACEKYSTKDKPRFVVGSIGPGTKLVTLGNTDWDTMYESYLEQCRGLLDGHIDVFLIETAQDILQVKCTVNACIEALKERNKTVADVPIMVQVTIEQFGTTLIGTDIAGVAAALRDLPILSLGMNCATGPAEMAEHVHYLANNWPGRISLLPNAGLPTLVEGRTETRSARSRSQRRSPSTFSSADQHRRRVLRHDARHIAALVKQVGERPHRSRNACGNRRFPADGRGRIQAGRVDPQCRRTHQRVWLAQVQAPARRGELGRHHEPGARDGA
ncbi:MAG: homocysteine S-methyltransferase family protein [Phycisphaerales bacterium]